MCHCNNFSFCPPWLHYGERKGRDCAIVYTNPGWGWGRSKEARGRGGPFSSSAQHKPVRKQADSFNNINERQTSGQQALRLWGPAGPSNREILPTLANLAEPGHVFIKRRERTFFVLFWFWFSMCVIAVIGWARCIQGAGDFQGPRLLSNVKNFPQW